MSYPNNPKTIILKNEYYPDGLTELDVWNYYQKTKSLILRETLGKKLMIFFSVDINKNIVIRKTKDGNFIRLNYNNYNDIISGRTLSIHSIMDKSSSYGIIDVDTDNFDLAKEATIDVYNAMEKERKFVDEVKVRYTGKKSFHIICYFKNDLYINQAKDMLEEFLVKNKMNLNYTIEHKRTGKIPNLDLNRNINNAGYITLHSLSVDGLRCIEINSRYIKNFRKDLAKIKKD